MGQSLLEWQRELKLPVAGKNNLKGCCISEKKEPVIARESKKQPDLFDFIPQSSEIRNSAIICENFTENDFRVAVMHWKLKNGLIPSSP